MIGTSTNNIKELGVNSTLFHTFKSAHENLLLEIDSGRILQVPTSLLNTIEYALDAGDVQRAEMMALMAGVKPINEPAIAPPRSVAVQSFSLAIAQKCNLGCTYCYAEQGTFGGRPDNMSIDVAKASVDRLFKDAPSGEGITLAFMGGEPLFNRKVLFETTEYAEEKAKELGQNIGFTLTTNGTLIRPEDAAFFHRYKFTVTVSIDGIGKTNDELRPYVSGKGSFDRIKEKLKLLFTIPNRNFKVLARVTVTPKNLDLPETFQGLLDLGFDSIQFSPMVKSPNGTQEMQQRDFDVLLGQLTACGEMFRKGFMNKQLLPLQNVLSTLNRIHNYQREMYPCGAGGGYMGVSADGELYACHRFVNDDEGHMGDVKNGVSEDKQEKWLKTRHLSEQSACTTCWARYMCSGSCHHEVIKRGRPACDYIRGWLQYCLGLYVDLLKTDPNGLALLLGDNNAITAMAEDEDGTGI